MLIMESPQGEIIQVETEYLGPGSWRTVVRDEEGRVLEVLGIGSSAAGLVGIGYAFVVRKNLQGWQAQRMNPSA